MLRVEEIDDDKRFWDLGVEWNRILGQSSTNNVFLTWEWISTFWKHFGKSKHLKLLFAEDANHRKLALAPLRLSDRVVGGFFRYSVLEPLAYGAIDNTEFLPAPDYTDLIIPKNNRECLSRFLDYLTEDKGWDFVYLADIPETSQTLKLLPTMKNQMGKIDFLKGVKCPYLPLSNVSIKDLQHHVKKEMKFLQRDYSHVEFKTYDEIGTVEQAFRAFVDLHEKGWKAKGRPGVMPTAELFDFYLDVSEVFAKKNWLGLDFLTVGDIPIACIYGFTYDGRFYFYISGFARAPAFAKYSIGNIMLYGAIKRSVDLGLKEFDFLKGDEPYKSRWTSTWRQNYHINLVNKRLKSEILDLCIKSSKFVGIDRLAGKLLKFT